jgi:hypothetical protein
LSTIWQSLLSYSFLVLGYWFLVTGVVLAEARKGLRDCGTRIA